MDGRGYAKILTLLYSIMIFLAIAWGGYVRAMGAGLGCGPDWPLCNGYLIPPNLFTDIQVFLEYFHRIIAMLTGLIALIATITVLKVYRDSNLAKLAILATDALLLIQIILGMFVVNTHLNQFLSATHLAIATLTFGISVLTVSIIHRL